MADIMEQLFSDEKKIEQAQRSKNDQSLTDWRDVLRRPEGRRVIWEFIAWGHPFGLSMTGNSNTFFREGERNMSLRAMGRVGEADPQSLLLMIKENMEKHEDE